MSEAIDILDAVVALVEANKSTVRTVTKKYQSLGTIQDEARKHPRDFPKAYVVIGGTERPFVSGETRGGTIGQHMRMLLPIWIDLYMPEKSDIQTEREAATKEVRDIVEANVNQRITANNHLIYTEEMTVERLITYTTQDVTELVLGAASVQFGVVYTYIRGNA